MSCENCGAVHSATDRIENDKRNHERKKLLTVCLSVVLGVALVCGTFLACYAIKQQQDTIREQQYALNMQYASLMEYIAGAEITTSEYSAEADGDGSISVAGDGNTTAGGDIVNGE